jgi:hypothetical protein
MAGALTHKGVHHTFQGCPASGGWSHSTSPDLVHWTDRGRGMHVLNETYMGMSSNSEPCAGFVTVDDNGMVRVQLAVVQKAPCMIIRVSYSCRYHVKTS